MDDLLIMCHPFFECICMHALACNHQVLLDKLFAAELRELVMTGRKQLANSKISRHCSPPVWSSSSMLVCVLNYAPMLLRSKDKAKRRTG